jgi:primosomal protein N' (replication factor Y)
VICRLLIAADTEHPQIQYAEVDVEIAALTGHRIESDQGPVVVLEVVEDDHSVSSQRYVFQTKTAVQVLNQPALQLAARIAQQYFVTLAEVLPLMLPPNLKRRAKAKAPAGSAHTAAKPDLSAAQAAIVEAIETQPAGDMPEHILWGVTGSGKTRIYEYLIESAIARGEQVLLLLPEIALSGQLMEIMTRRFPQNTVLYHSGLSDGERAKSHSAFLTGGASIAIGTRSAVMLPAKHLGLIIIDEEHDASYKDMRQIRFDTRTVARLRQQLPAGELKPKLLLGSATPTLDTLMRARSENAALHRLRHRATGQSLPTVHVPTYSVQSGLIGPFLREKMHEHLTDKNQVLLLMNRRGHSTHVHCATCGTFAECPRCTVALTYHKDNVLRCHQCGFQQDYTRTCPKDGTPRQLTGRGIQRVEEILDGQFSSYSYARLDRDTARKRGFADDVMQSMRAGGIDILIGTQMIAKGFDIEGVTLVGVLAIDQMLTAADFRASENAWQLLSQVVGRSGRHKPGEVVIQTMAPEHPVIQAVKAHDADAFYHHEADIRRKTKYPPFASLARILMTADDENHLHRLAEKLARDIAPANTEQLFSNETVAAIELLGPALPAVNKIEDVFRVQFLIKATNQSALRSYAERILPVLQHYRRNFKVQLVLDLEPREMI